MAEFFNDAYFMNTSWTLDANDPARAVIVARAKALGITGAPEKAAHALGPVTLADGRTVAAYVVHAVDAIITDGTYIVMIDRVYDPGKGKPALPGGLIDPLPDGTVETPVRAAAREAMEEAGITLGDGRPVGPRNMDRPFDIRGANETTPNYDLGKKYGIRHGDVFMVSTQAVRFDVPNLTRIPLTGGDDAMPGTARLVARRDISRATVGIPDHADMIAAAFAA